MIQADAVDIGTAGLVFSEMQCASFKNIERMIDYGRGLVINVDNVGHN
jgi:hypothetical protein